MEAKKYFFNNNWQTHHPTINFFTFEAFCIEAFGHKCIIEHVQDGEIWSDEEYWGTIFYDFEIDRYTYMSTYLSKGKEIERILSSWLINHEDNVEKVWDGKISEDFETEKEKWAIDFYKSYIESGTYLDFETYYKKVYGKDNRKDNRPTDNSLS